MTVHPCICMRLGPVNSTAQPQTSVAWGSRLHGDGPQWILGPGETQPPRRSASALWCKCGQMRCRTIILIASSVMWHLSLSCSLSLVGDCGNTVISEIYSNNWKCVWRRIPSVSTLLKCIFCCLTFSWSFNCLVSCSVHCMSHPVTIFKVPSWLWRH